MSKEKKTTKGYNKTRGEHIKDVVIAVLITGIVAFIAGMQFQNGQLQAAIETLAPVAQAEQPKKD